MKDSRLLFSVLSCVIDNLVERNDEVYFPYFRYSWDMTIE